MCKIICLQKNIKQHSRESYEEFTALVGNFNIPLSNWHNGRNIRKLCGIFFYTISKFDIMDIITEQ